MRKFILFFIIVLVFTSCTTRPNFYGKNTPSRTYKGYYTIIESVEYIDSTTARYIIRNRYIDSVGRNVNGGSFYYYGTIGEFNVGDKIQFVKE